MRYDGMVNQANALVGKGHWLCRVVRLAMVGMPEKALGLVPEVTCWNLMECETVVIVPLPVPFEHPKRRTKIRSLCSLQAYRCNSVPIPI